MARQLYRVNARRSCFCTVAGPPPRSVQPPSRRHTGRYLYRCLHWEPAYADHFAIQSRCAAISTSRNSSPPQGTPRSIGNLDGM